MEIMTARQMRKLAKEKQTERKFVEKLLKANEKANPEVVKQIIDMFQTSSSYLADRWLPLFPDDNGDIYYELKTNFTAYKRAFQKLGYTLSYHVDCSGSMFSVSF